MKNSIIYIIGVDHLIQYRNSILSESLFDSFAGFIAECISRYDITAAAEEFNREYLDEVYFSPEATVESAAVKAGVIHVFCDPVDAERSRLGIPYFADIRDMVKEKYGIREKLITDINMLRKIEQETIEESKKYRGIREEYWYEIISGIPHINILFVCGHEHVMRFSDLLKHKGICAVVLEKFWQSDVFSDYRNLGLR